MKATTSPPARTYHAVAYDAGRKRTVLFGGFNAKPTNAYLADTWEWDGRKWMQAKPTASPAARLLHAMAYDPVRQRTVVFGGNKAYTGDTAETWEWDGKNWRERKPKTTLPTKDYMFSMAFHAGIGRTIVYGGAITNETWSWNGIDGTLGDWARPLRTKTTKTGSRFLPDPRAYGPGPAYY
jgi:hypothetical protein